MRPSTARRTFASQPGPAHEARSAIPHYHLYHQLLRPLLDGRGAAWLNAVSERELGYPALLVTEVYEARAVVARAEKDEAKDAEKEK